MMADYELRKFYQKHKTPLCNYEKWFCTVG
jgi:hypothetical protein